MQIKKTVVFYSHFQSHKKPHFLLVSFKVFKEDRIMILGLPLLLQLQMCNTTITITNNGKKNALDFPISFF